MLNFDYVPNENIKEHNPKWKDIPDHPCWILIIGGSGSGITNALLNLVNNEPDFDKMYLHAKYLYEANYQFLIDKRGSIGLKCLNDSKPFFKYSHAMNDIYKNVDEHNPNKKRKILIVFDAIIVDTLINKKLNPIVTELFIRGRKLNISLVFIAQSYFPVPKNIRLNSTHYFVMKISNKRELQQIAFESLLNLYKKCIETLYSFLVIYTTLALDNPLRFRKNLSERIYKLIIEIDDMIRWKISIWY